MSGRNNINLRIILRPVITIISKYFVLNAIRKCFDILRLANDIASGIMPYEIGNSPPFHRLAVDVEDTMDHLDAITGQTDNALDIIDAILRRFLEDHNVTASGGMPEDPPIGQPGTKWQGIF